MNVNLYNKVDLSCPVAWRSLEEGRKVMNGTHAHTHDGIVYHHADTVFLFTHSSKLCQETDCSYGWSISRQCWEMSSLQVTKNNIFISFLNNQMATTPSPPFIVCLSNVTSQEHKDSLILMSPFLSLYIYLYIYTVLLHYLYCIRSLSSAG